MPKRQSGNKKGKQSNFAKLSIFQPNKYKFKKTCPLSGKGAPAVDYKNVRLLKKYMSENGKILPSRITNVSQKKQEAQKIFEQINKKEFVVKKLNTENNELYGSVKPTEIAKLIQEENKIDIKPSMIQPVEEIKSLGKFKVKVSLHSEVDAEITINVTSADTIQ